jgi:uncharacterized cupredoxin-like copper-binding protein
MSPDFRKIALIAGALGLLVSLYFALSPGGDDETATPATTAATTQQGTTTTEPAATTTEPSATTAPSGPVRFTITAGGAIERGKVKVGREVQVVVSSDVADEVHLHGYDLSAEVAPGEQAEIEFDATIPGQFEIELENRGQLIGVLEVSP